MKFGVYHIGATYKTANLKDLGTIQWADRQLANSFLENMAAEFGIGECFFLASCNRREFYFHAPELNCEPKTFFREFLNRLAIALGTDIEPGWFSFRQDREAVLHLFRVASALESMVLGETEIIRQIKDQFELSKSAGICGKYMRTLVEQALRASKQVRSRTRVTRNVVSMPSLIYRSTVQFLQARPQKRVVFVGAGQFMESVLTPFGKERNLDLVFVNRTLTHRFSDQYGGRVLTLTQFLANPPEFDVLVSATGSHNTIFTRTWIEQHCGSRAVFLVDCALPSDIDPATSQLPNIHLLGLREMEETLMKNREQREAEIPKANPIFEQAMLELAGKWWEYGLSGIHGCISQHYQFVGEKALRALGKQLPNLQEQDLEVLEQWTSQLVTRLVKVPILGLKGVARELGEPGVDAWCREVGTGAGVYFEKVNMGA